jgi:hypothetical protein
MMVLHHSTRIHAFPLFTYSRYSRIHVIHDIHVVHVFTYSRHSRIHTIHDIHAIHVVQANPEPETKPKVLSGFCKILLAKAELLLSLFVFVRC